MEILAVRGENKLTLLVYNYNIPGAKICAEDVTITLKTIVSNVSVTITWIDNDSANPK